MGPAVVTFAMTVGCSCCCCGSGPAPVPVPETHAGYLGRWVCADGDTHELRADGTYVRRDGDHVEPPRAILRYDAASFTVDASETALGLRLVQETTVGVGAVVDESGQLCASFDGAACARIERDLPAAAIGRWRGADGVQVDLRRDGLATVRSRREPARSGLVVGTGGSLRLCAPPEVVALAFDEDGVPTWDGAPLELVERDWDEHAIAAEAARRAAARSSGGSRGGGGGADFDFD